MDVDPRVPVCKEKIELGHACVNIRSCGNGDTLGAGSYDVMLK